MPTSKRQQQAALPWWKSAIIYQVYPQSFQDSNGDGIGDLQGLISRLDYIADLGVNTIWLNPIYQSPLDDNGYDISDYYNIHPMYGSMEDFDQLLVEMHRRGLRLLMDLVVNHCSDEHVWFQEARKSKDNPYRDFFYWQDGEKGVPPNNWKSFFGGSVWEWNEPTQDYFLHYFTKRQPDLNWENPTVREEIYKLMRFWLDKGIDGFRMDVISLISKHTHFPNSESEAIGDHINNWYANGPLVHKNLQEMHREVLSKYDILTVGEGPGINSENAVDYVGENRNELNMIFQLDHMFADFGPGGKFDPIPVDLVWLKNYYTRWNNVFDKGGWITSFLDNHDFARMISRFGNDENYRAESAKLLCTLVLTMPGTPCIYFGSEIGMTNVQFPSIKDYKDVETLNFYEEHLSKGGVEADFLPIVYQVGRDNVRTPMHWDNSENAGFSIGTPWIKMNPNYQEINVIADQNSQAPIQDFYKKMISLRKEIPALTFGTYLDLLPRNSRLFIYERKWKDHQFVVILNMSNDEINLEEDITIHFESYQILLNNYADIDTKKLNPWQSVILQKYYC